MAAQNPGLPRPSTATLNGGRFSIVQSGQALNGPVQRLKARQTGQFNILLMKAVIYTIAESNTRNFRV